MKYKLYKELLVGENILSHVFLNSTPPELSHRIADETTRLMNEHGKSEKWITENREIDLTLTIEGIEVNAKDFFQELWNQYETQVKKEASKLVKEQTSEKLNEIFCKLQSMEEITNELADDINWNYKSNIFNKE